jgi:hypothetical protein
VVERSCSRLPFGFTDSPFTFTKVVKVIDKDMRSKGFKCQWFLDNCLVALPTRGQAMLARTAIEDLLECSGFTRAVDKGCFAVATQVLPDHLRSLHDVTDLFRETSTLHRADL